MEENEIEAQVRKFPRIGNGEEDGEVRTTNRFHSWHHSSRIIRVSRASGGKDRHSKVMTSKGLRDRRVRLSVTTAIQFYDLQDRLGYDQPSKAVEWLIKSASDSIAELPSLNTTFPETPKENNEQGFDGESENENENGNNKNDLQRQNNNDVNNQSQNISLSKSACSSTSETSKGSGSGLSLSRSDTRVNRVKARERARERTAKEKEKEKKQDNNNNNESRNVNPISQTASFTELLTGGISNVVAIPTTASPGGCDEPNNMLNKAGRQQWCASTPMDYFLGPSSYRTHRSHNHHHQSSSVSQIQVGHSLHEAMNVSAFNMSGENHQQSSSSNPNQMQHLSFIPDHLMPAVVTSSSSCASHQHDQASGNNDYNLNFTMSSGLAGYNRGTLQSNSPSLLPQMQRFSPIDGSTVPFFFGAAPSAAVTPMENNNHHLSSVFDGGHLQLYYADGCRHSDRKGKTKN